MLYKVVLTFESVDLIVLMCDHINRTSEQFLNVVLFIMVYRVVLPFESFEGKILKCSH